MNRAIQIKELSCNNIGGAQNVKKGHCYYREMIIIKNCPCK